MNQSTSLAPIKPDPYIENWRAVLGTASNHLKFVRILGGVGTVTNGSVLLRAPIAVGDGFYKLVGSGACRMLPVTDIQGSIFDSVSDKSRWSRPKYYPDVEQFNPRMEEVPVLSYILKEDIFAMMNLCQDILQDRSHGDRYLVVIGDRYIASAGDLGAAAHRIDFNFSIPDGEELILESQALKIALTECSKYDSVAVRLKKTRYSVVLILGDGWRTCAMVTCAVKKLY